MVYDYYAAAWDGPQGRLEVFVMMIMMNDDNDDHGDPNDQDDHDQDAVVVTNPDYMDEMGSSVDYLQQQEQETLEDGVNPPPPVKVSNANKNQKNQDNVPKHGGGFGKTS